MVRRQISKTTTKTGAEVDLVYDKSIHGYLQKPKVCKVLKRAMRKRESRKAKLELKGIEY